MIYTFTVYCILDKVNAAWVSRRDSFRTIKTAYYKLFTECVCVRQCVYIYIYTLYV